MKRLFLMLLLVGLAGCKYELLLAFENRGTALDILFYRTVFGMQVPFDMECLTKITVVEAEGGYEVWRAEREGSACYSGSKISYGQRLRGYSGHFETLRPGKTYVVSVYGSGASGSGKLVVPE